MTLRLNVLAMCAAFAAQDAQHVRLQELELSRVGMPLQKLTQFGRLAGVVVAHDCVPVSRT